MSKKPQGQFVNYSQDPAVQNLIQQAASSPAGRLLNDKQRKQKARDQKRNRQNIDMPPALAEKLATLAAELGVSFSSLANYLLASSLDGLDMNRVRGDLEITRSPRFEYKLIYKKNS